MTAHSEIGRLRRQQIVNLSMTELMILLVFMAVTFSFLAREEDLVEIPAAQVRIAELEASLQQAKHDIAVLQKKLQEADAENERLRRALDRLRPVTPTPNPGQPAMVSVPEPTWRQLQAENESLKRIVAQQQKDIADLRRQIKDQGNKAPGLPRCIVTSGFLLTITLQPDGYFRGSKAWDTGAEQQALALPGIERLSSGASLSTAEFRTAATELRKSGEAQEIPCRFTVLVKRETVNVDQYERQLNLLDEMFYYRRSK